MHTYYANRAGGLAQVPDVAHDYDVFMVLQRYATIDYADYGQLVKRQEVYRSLNLVPVWKKGQLRATIADDMCAVPDCARQKHMLNNVWVGAHPLCFQHYAKLKVLIRANVCSEMQARRWGLLRKR